MPNWFKQVDFRRIDGDTLMITVAALTATSTVVISMVLNVWAFTREVNSLFGWAVGILLPLWVLGLTAGCKRMLDRQHTALAIASCVLALFLLIVSMPHLAAGYGSLGINVIESWALAITTDLCQIVMKAIVITILQPITNSEPDTVLTEAHSRRNQRRRTPTTANGSTH